MTTMETVAGPIEGDGIAPALSHEYARLRTAGGKNDGGTSEEA